MLEKTKSKKKTKKYNKNKNYVRKQRADSAFYLITKTM